MYIFGTMICSSCMLIINRTIWNVYRDTVSNLPEEVLGREDYYYGDDDEEYNYDEPGDNYGGIDDDLEEEEADVEDGTVDEGEAPFFRSERGTGVFAAAEAEERQRQAAARGRGHGGGRGCGRGGTTATAAPPAAPAVIPDAKAGGSGKGRGKNGPSKEEVGTKIINVIEKLEGSEEPVEMTEIDHQFEVFKMRMSRTLTINQQYDLLDDIGRMVSGYIRRVSGESRQSEVAAAAGSSRAPTVMGPPQVRAVAPMGVPDVPGFPQPPTATSVGDFYQPERSGDGTLASLQVYHN